MENGKKPMANPVVLLREEFDDWAVLFDPDKGVGFGLDPTGVYLWKLLDGQHSTDQMLGALRRDALDVPQEAGEQILAFVEELAQQGLAGYGPELTQNHREHLTPSRTRASDSQPADKKENLAGNSPRKKSLIYAKPSLVCLSHAWAEGKCQSGNSVLSGKCQTGNGVGLTSCTGGSQAPSACSPGVCPGSSCQTGACG